ncbi:MAG: PAAR-like domain-containing protein [Candidatus Electrothrix sp. GW3-4]|uniref:PAAR-like domain-containing protein n=1 Tax=Candidatus Electrothrix sp. GW3-4 TaxID=3126740 RepID=UPI0030CCD681
MVAIFPASTKGGGNCLGAPDVCLTPAPPAPPVPTPYPNSGMVNQAKKTSKKVKFAGKEAVTVSSEISRSMGDEAGVNKGVMSGMNMSKITFKKGSSKVKAQGKKCVHLTSVTGHNGSNANMPAGAQIAPSQTKVKVAP